MNNTNENAVTTTASELLTRKQAAAYLTLCITSLERLGIPHTQLGRRVLYRKSTLDKWIEQHETAPVKGAQ
ncbi:MAG: hypothetical protein Ta2B_08280 [Termitinemataceae bacterium]|nr:MAG: hypothetical protein Ta2B_08280 [Termitinemataceae bacterium]